MKLFLLNHNSANVDAIKAGIGQHISPQSSGVIRVSTVQPAGQYVVHVANDDDATALCRWLDNHSVVYQVRDAGAENFGDVLAEMLPFFAGQCGVTPYGAPSPGRQEALNRLVSIIFGAQS